MDATTGTSNSSEGGGGDLVACFGAAASTLLQVPLSPLTAAAAAATRPTSTTPAFPRMGGSIDWIVPPATTEPPLPPLLPPPEAAQVPPSNVLVAGPPGCGKSYLLEHGAAAGVQAGRYAAACHVRCYAAVAALEPGNAVAAMHRLWAAVLTRVCTLSPHATLLLAVNDIDALCPAPSRSHSSEPAAPPAPGGGGGGGATALGQALGQTGGSGSVGGGARPSAPSAAAAIGHDDAPDTDASRVFASYARGWRARVVVAATARSAAAVHPLVASCFTVAASITAPDATQAGALLQCAVARAGMGTLPLADACTLAHDTAAGFLAGDFAAVAAGCAAARRTVSAACGLPPAGLSVAALWRRVAANHTPATAATGTPVVPPSVPRSSPAATVASRHAGDADLPTDLRGVSLRLPALSGDDAASEVASRARWLATGGSGGGGRGESAADAEDDADDARAGMVPIPAAVAALLRVTTVAVPMDAVTGQDAAKAALAAALMPRSASAPPPPRGILLYGPPGTGKTLLAKAAATALGARFLALSIPAILRAGVGESERALAAAFNLARAAAPAVLFMDELQALFVSRSGSGGGGGGGDEGARWAASLTSQLLLCLDRALADSERGAARVTVLAATNIPEVLDAALLRAGRFDRIVYVGLPATAERAAHFRAGIARMAAAGVVAADTSTEPVATAMAAASDACSYADCTNALRAALAAALRRAAGGPPAVTADDLRTSAAALPRSVPPARLAELAAWGAARR